MPGTRLELLQKIVEKDPTDSFSKYAMGLEYCSLKDFEKAREIFEELKNSDTSYHASYYQLGKVYEKLGDEHMAKKIYEQGIFIISAQGELHAKSELEQAVNELLI